MKKILFILLLVTGYARAQLPTIPGFTNINQKYQWYGVKPPPDTTYSKYGFASKGDSIYWGNGVYYKLLATGSGGFVNPMTTLGDIIYGAASGTPTRLGGNITAVPQTLRSTGTGSAATAPVWNDASLYIPNGELPGDVIVPIPNGRDMTNQHTAATYADGIITGCVVSYVGGLTYRVNSPCVYNINGTQYTLPGASDVTLPDGTASAGEFRTDAIVVTTSSTATSVLGDNSVGGVGESAQADPSTQFLLSYVRIDEANTAPTGIGQLIVRDEGSGGEWTISKTVTSTDNYSTNPFHLTISQRITGANSGQYMQWIAPSLQSKSQFTTLLLYIRNNSAYANVRNLTATLRNGNATQVGNAINLTTYGWVKTALGSYQTIAIPMSAFAGADGFDRIRITNTQVGGTVDIQIDYVQLQSGIVQPPTGGGPTEHYGEADSIYTTRRRSNFRTFSHDFVNVSDFIIKGQATTQDSLFTVLGSDGSVILRVASNGSIVYMSQAYIGNNFLVTASGANMLNGTYMALNGGSEFQGFQQAVNLVRRWVDAGSDVNIGVRINNSTEITSPAVIDSMVYKPLQVGFKSIETGVYNPKLNVFASGYMQMFDGPNPSGTPSGGIYLWSNSGELKVKDASGNTTTISPHDFSGIPQGASNPMAWAYYSEKEGKYINVDMYKLAELVEKLTGEKLIYTGNINEK